MSPRPGTIIHDESTGFSRALLERADDRVWFSEEFYRARHRILSLVTGRADPPPPV